MKAIKFTRSGGDLCFGGKVELRQWGQKTASLIPEPVSSAQCFLGFPSGTGIQWMPPGRKLGLHWAYFSQGWWLSIVWCLKLIPMFLSSFLVFYGGSASLVPGFPGGSDSKASTRNAGDLGRSPGEGNGNPLQYSCLENAMDGGGWWATVHGVAKSQTQLSDFTLVWYQWLFHDQKQKFSGSTFRGWLWLLSSLPADFRPLCARCYFLIGSSHQVQWTLLKPHPSRRFHSIWFSWLPSPSWNPLFLWLSWDSELFCFCFYNHTSVLMLTWMHTLFPSWLQAPQSKDTKCSSLRTRPSVVLLTSAGAP